jgi:putative transcriptional regulator
VAHPASDLLLSFATGRADLPHRVMLEAHLAGCADCRAAVAEMSAPGGTLLRGLPGAPLSAGLWGRLRERIAETPIPQHVPPLLAGLPLPAAALAELPPIHRLHWRWGFVRGGRLTALVRDPATHSHLLIGYSPPQRTFPRHLHVGPEDIVVLTGGYEDEAGHYEAGEYASYEPGTIHQPVVVPGETCWTLTRLETPNRLFGWQGLAQRLLT